MSFSVAVGRDKTGGPEKPMASGGEKVGLKARPGGGIRVSLVDDPKYRGTTWGISGPVPWMAESVRRAQMLGFGSSAIEEGRNVDLGRGIKSSQKAVFRCVRRSLRSSGTGRQSPVRASKYFSTAYFRVKKRFRIKCGRFKDQRCLIRHPRTMSR